ncbi:MAG: hypothetical protein Q8K23_05950 [Sulfuritalea sp.]|nr:hypothetical protein [Sulfuritalea sp.]
MSTAPADRQPRKPPAAREFTLGGVVLKKLGPGAAGTKRLATRFGSALVCVRYRDDPARDRRLTTVELTTVELIVEERPLPGPLAVRIGYEEAALRKQAKAAGGWWDGQRKLWLLPRAAVRKLKLDNRVVAEKA